jgi:hypothetical protein
VVVLAAAVVPHPPILVPALAAGAAPELASLLDACDEVVSALTRLAPELVVCLGPGERTHRHGARDWGTLAGYGVAVEAPRRHDDGPARLPLSLTVGRWLLERVGWTGAVLLQEVAAGSATPDCGQLGRQLDDEAGPRAAWLVLGDGSNRRGPRSPGHDDPRAEGFDAGIAAALGTGDTAALTELEAALAAELGAGGRAPWQALAAAAEQTTTTTAQTRTAQTTTAQTRTGQSTTAQTATAQTATARTATATTRIEATLRYDAAPFGVEYLVADWRFAL